MQSYTVYNLTSPDTSFQCGGYTFTQVANYESILTGLFRRANGTRTGMNAWQLNPQRPGAMAVTYHATWNGPDRERRATIHRNTPLLLDILLLWSLWGGEYTCAGERSANETPTFHGNCLFEHRSELIAAIDKVLAAFVGNTLADELGFYPGTFFLLESMRTETVDYKTLFISPVIDLLASKETLEPLIQEQAMKLSLIKIEIATVLEKHKPADPEKDALWRNTLGPFSGRLNSLGAPAAVDKLSAFLKHTPALRELSLSDDVTEFHARAFNQFRNATLHYAGLPKDVRLKFGSGRSVRVNRDADQVSMLRVMIYYTRVFQDLLVLHFLRIASIASPWGEGRCVNTLRDFFVDGKYNGHDWVRGAFKDYVVDV